MCKTGSIMQTSLRCLKKSTKKKKSAKEKEEDKMEKVNKRDLRTGTMIKIGKMRYPFMCVLYIPDVPLVNL